MTSISPATAAYTAPIQATATAASGSCWARESTIAPVTSAAATTTAATAGEQGAALDQQGHRAERHQQAGGHEGRTPTRRPAPRA